MLEIISQLKVNQRVKINGFKVNRPHQNTYSVVSTTLKSYEIEDMIMQGNSPVKFFYNLQDVVTFLTTSKVQNNSWKPAKRAYGNRDLAYFDSINPERESGVDWS